MDRFHKLFPNDAEPKLPIHLYQQLLNKYDEDTAFEFLCNYEEGFATLSDIKHAIEAEEQY